MGKGQQLPRAARGTQWDRVAPTFGLWVCRAAGGGAPRRPTPTSCRDLGSLCPAPPRGPAPHLGAPSEAPPTPACGAPLPHPHSSKALPPLRPPPHHEVLLHPCPEPHLGPLLCRPSGPLFQLSLQVAGPRAGPGRPTHPPGLPSPVATRMQGRRGKQVLIPEQAQEACVSVLGSL